MSSTVANEGGTPRDRTAGARGATTDARSAAAPASGSAHSSSLLLEAKSLHRTYRMGAVEVKVLKGASLRVQQGEWIAVLGSSGSGKSTLLHILGALDRPDPGGGSVLFRGDDIGSRGGRARDRYRRVSVGFVFQFYHLLPELSVLENTMLPARVGRGPAAWIAGRAAAHARARELLDAFGLGHRLAHRPRELSGGECQRVAIARALMNRPEVLLADEPTGNLDAHTGGEILDLLAQGHRQGLTMVMVTHDPKVAERADRVIRLVDGRVEDG